jgi:hypothetical protein
MKVVHIEIDVDVPSEDEARELVHAVMSRATCIRGYQITDVEDSIRVEDSIHRR